MPVAVIAPSIPKTGIRRKFKPMFKTLPSIVVRMASFCLLMTYNTDTVKLFPKAVWIPANAEKMTSAKDASLKTEP